MRRPCGSLGDKIIATVSNCLCPHRDLRPRRNNTDAVPSFTLLGRSLLLHTLPPIAELLVGDVRADVTDLKKRKKQSKLVEYMRFPYQTVSN